LDTYEEFVKTRFEQFPDASSAQVNARGKTGGLQCCISPTPGLNSFDQHICQILGGFWICCTIKVILAYEPITVKPIMQNKRNAFIQR